MPEKCPDETRRDMIAVENKKFLYFIPQVPSGNDRREPVSDTVKASIRNPDIKNSASFQGAVDIPQQQPGLDEMVEYINHGHGIKGIRGKTKGIQLFLDKLQAIFLPRHAATAGGDLLPGHRPPFLLSHGQKCPASRTDVEKRPGDGISTNDFQRLLVDGSPQNTPLFFCEVLEVLFPVIFIPRFLIVTALSIDEIAFETTIHRIAAVCVPFPGALRSAIWTDRYVHVSPLTGSPTNSNKPLRTVKKCKRRTR